MEEQQQKSRLMVTPARLETRILRALEVQMSSQRHLDGYRMMHGGSLVSIFIHCGSQSILPSQSELRPDNLLGCQSLHVG